MRARQAHRRDVRDPLEDEPILVRRTIQFDRLSRFWLGTLAGRRTVSDYCDTFWLAHPPVVDRMSHALPAAGRSHMRTSGRTQLLDHSTNLLKSAKWQIAGVEPTPLFVASDELSKRLDHKRSLCVSTHRPWRRKPQLVRQSVGSKGSCRSKSGRPHHRTSCTEYSRERGKCREALTKEHLEGERS